MLDCCVKCYLKLTFTNDELCLRSSTLGSLAVSAGAAGLCRLQPSTLFYHPFVELSQHLWPFRLYSQRQIRFKCILSKQSSPYFLSIDISYASFLFNVFITFIIQYYFLFLARKSIFSANLPYKIFRVRMDGESMVVDMNLNSMQVFFVNLQ